ncbi:hypothetical protein AYK20_00245 [Thermoplasmatales archaeon SG8-52-1]|nr:MAG: hypothetical protein AYK20_00245 [Thermoplasmatales archaeon SG8-52-1]
MKKKLWNKTVILLIVFFYIITSLSPVLEISRKDEQNNFINLNAINDFSSQQPVTISNYGEIVNKETLDPNDYGDGYIEHMEDCIVRDVLIRSELNKESSNKKGIWVIPSRGSTYYPYSGNHYVINKWGDPKMGISFPTEVDVHGAWFAGQGGGEGAWAKSIRVLGYLNNEITQITDWFEDIDETPSYFSMNLQDVNRIVIEATPVYNGAGWYAMDDFTYSYKIETEQEKSETIIFDFEDCSYKQNLNDSNYGGLIWEDGKGEFYYDENDLPKQETHSSSSGNDNPINSPKSINSFQGVIRGDAESWSYPPDSCGAVGPNHFVETVNRNFAVYDKSTGEELINILLGSFLPGSNGDPRVLYDQYSNRWIVIVCDFTTKIYLAVSMSDDPTAEWFKCDFVVSQGSDIGKWPDYPTLGVDEDGIYTAAYMIGGSYGMSIFALEKAPLIAPEPSLGEIYAFRELPFEGAIQPVHAFGSSEGEYFVSRMSETSIRIRLLTDLLTDPTLTELGCATIPSHSEPPDAPALGSSIPLDTVGHRLMNAVYRDGYIWTAHCIGLDGRAASRWYKIDVANLLLDDYGTISDPVMHYFFPTIMVNSGGNLAMGFSGSSPEQYASAYYTGRLASDPPGEMDPPVLLKEGENSYNLIDGYGRNRWGDYSLCSLDPIDEYTLWTIQEYAHSPDGDGENRWGTWIGELEYGNRVPGTPTIDGPINGNIDTPYNYTFNAVDPDDDDLFIYIKWGDGYIEFWEGPYSSGQEFEICHTYSKEGAFTIEAKVKDTNDLESGWATLNVTMPRNTEDFNSLFYRFLERFPILENLFISFQRIFGE